MEAPAQPPYALTCHRCRRAMDFYTEEVVGDTRVAIFRCAECDTLEAVERGSTD
jgi:hypothetical protein